MPRRSAAAASAGRSLADAGEKPDDRGTRGRILDVALDLFTEQGYDKTTLRQIAEPLGFTQAAIYYHFAAKQDILIALHMRLHKLGKAVLDQAETEAGPAGWAAALRGLVDTVMANRKLFVLHQRNQTAFLTLHHKGHDGDHEELDQRFRQILSDPAFPIRDRIRLSCALGALQSALLPPGNLEDLDPTIYGELIREAITDLLDPAGSQPSQREEPTGNR